MTKSQPSQEPSSNDVLNLGKASPNAANDRTIAASTSQLNELAVFKTVKIASTSNNARQGSSPEDQIVQLVKFQQFPETRAPFVASCLEIFKDLNMKWQAQHAGNGNNNRVIVEASHRYQQKIFEFAQGATGSESIVFSGIHSIWYLAHIIFFEHTRGIPIAGGIDHWLRLNHNWKLTDDFEKVSKLAHPSQDPNFWPVIQRLVLRGFFEAAEKLLSHLPGYQRDKSGSNNTILTSNPVQAFKSLTKKLPKFENYPKTINFKNAWQKWNLDAAFVYDGGCLSSLDIPPNDLSHFVPLFAILAGKEASILSSASTWQEAVMGLLQFTFPMNDGNQLGQLSNIVKEKFESSNTVLDTILLSIFEKDVGLVMSRCLTFDWWLVTHLVDLLEKGQFLDASNDQLKLPESMRISEWYLINFSEFVFTCPSLWREALDYLIQCPISGKGTLEILIPQIPLGDEAKVKNVLAYCDQYNLKEAKNSILRILGRKSFQEEDFGNAILHYLEGNDLHRLSFVCDHLLNIYMNRGDDSYRRAVENLPNNSLNKCKRLAFLAKYHQFQEYCEKRSFKEAAELSILLFTSGSVPKVFKSAFLLELLPLLKDGLHLFTAEQIMELMRVTEDCFTTKLKQNYLPSSRNVQTTDSKPEEEDILNEVRLSLASALAAAIQ